MSKHIVCVTDNLAVSEALDELDWWLVFVWQKCAVEFEIKAFCSENQDEKVDKQWGFFIDIYLYILPMMLYL